MEVATAPIMPVEQPTKDDKRSKKCRNIDVAVEAVVMVLILVFFILNLTVSLKVKNLVITVNSMNLNDFDVSYDMARMRALLNMTVIADLSVRNPNKVEVEVTKSSALLGYRGQPIGEAPIPSGRISADSTLAMNIAVMADRPLSNVQTYSDITAGVLPLTTYTEISGKVFYWNVIEIQGTSAVSCDINAFISNSTIDDPQCKYETKL